MLVMQLSACICIKRVAFTSTSCNQPALPLQDQSGRVPSRAASPRRSAAGRLQASGVGSLLEDASEASDARIEQLQTEVRGRSLHSIPDWAGLVLLLACACLAACKGQLGMALQARSGLANLWPSWALGCRWTLCGQN